MDMSTQQPKAVPRKPQVGTQSHSDLQIFTQQGLGELQRTTEEMSLGDTKLEVQRLVEHIAELRCEEQRLKELITKLEHKQFTLQEGNSQASLKEKEKQLMEREHEFYLRQERFQSEVLDKEFVIKKRERELLRLEDQLNAQKKEMALAKFDEESEGMGMSSAQLAKLAEKEVALQRREERLEQKELELNDWALRLDQQAKLNQQRQMEIQQRESIVHVPAHYPVGEGLTRPYSQWGSETTRHQEHPPTTITHYHQEQRQPSSIAANTNTMVGTHPGSPGYQHYPQQDGQYQEPINQYQSPQFYRQHQSPSGPGGTGMIHSDQTQPTETPCTGHSYQLPENEAKVFSVGDGSNPHIEVSSSGVASAANPNQYHSEGGAVGRSNTLDQSEECARALQWEEQHKAKHQEDSDLELARRLQKQFDEEAKSTQQHNQSADQLLALQLQHEDLKEEYGSGLTHNNQLIGEGDGSQVTEVVKKALDEKMTRQLQIREQEEADRRIAETISGSDLGDSTLQNNLSS